MINNERLSGLEAGRRMVLSCFIVITVLAAVCTKLYFDKVSSDNKYNNLQNTLHDKVEAIQKESNEKIEKIQSDAAIKYESFVEAQLAKEEARQEQYRDILTTNRQVKQQAIKNNVKLKTLINNNVKAH